MKDPTLLRRFTDLAHRFALAREALGLSNAVKTQVTSRWSSALQRIHLPDHERDFWFRGWSDAGVVGHLYKPGFEIVDTPALTVRRIIDAGANIGAETLRFRLFHPQATVVAIEAAKLNFEILERNFAGDPQAVLIHGGLWRGRTGLVVHEGSSHEGYRVIEAPPGEPADIEAFGVRDIMERMGWDALDILKLDIEGAEAEVFAEGTEDWLPLVRCLVFECPDNDRAGTAMQIFRSAQDQDFDVFISGEKIVMIRHELPWSMRRIRAIP